MPQARRRRGGVERIASRRERVTESLRVRQYANKYFLKIVIGVLLLNLQRTRMPQARRRRGGVERVASRRERVTKSLRYYFERACEIVELKSAFYIFYLAVISSAR